MKVLIVFSLIFNCLIISCRKEDPATPESDKLTLSFSSKHYDYFKSKSDLDIIDTAWQEKYYEWMVEQLNIIVPEKIQYYKYRDQAHKLLLTGEAGNGFAEIGTYKLHTIWKAETHESVHVVVTKVVGHPPALFNEGIAVAYSANYFIRPDFIPCWNNQDFNVLSKSYRQNGNIPSLDKLLGTVTFWDFSSNITYPISGSFIRFLINQYGIAKMKSFITISDFYDSKIKIHNDFYNTYGKTIESAWDEWDEFISNYQE